MLEKQLEFWKSYFKSKIKNFFRWSTFINIELGYFISFLIVAFSSFIKLSWGVTLGFLGLFACMIYNDAKVGRWRGNIREEYKIKGFEMRIKELEDENKKLKERLDGIPKAE